MTSGYRNAIYLRSDRPILASDNFTARAESLHAIAKLHFSYLTVCRASLAGEQLEYFVLHDRRDGERTKAG